MIITSLYFLQLAEHAVVVEQQTVNYSISVSRCFKGLWHW